MPEMFIKDPARVVRSCIILGACMSWSCSLPKGGRWGRARVDLKGPF